MKRNFSLAACIPFVFFFTACTSLKKQHVIDPAFEVVDFPSAEKKFVEIKGYLFKPPGAGPFPAIVALHGCSGLFRKSGKMNPRDLEWGKRLSQAGYLVIYPDSFTTRNIDEICTHKQVADMPKRVRRYDAYGALQWLSQRPDVSKEKIGLMGWSNGGSTLLWAIDENLKLPEEIKTDFKYAIAFYPGCFAVSKEKSWQPRIPLDIHMGALDNWTSPKKCQVISERSDLRKKVNLTLYPDSYHDFDEPHRPLIERQGLAYTVNGHSATMGTNEAAREKAVNTVMKTLSEQLK